MASFTFGNIKKYYRARVYHEAQWKVLTTSQHNLVVLCKNFMKWNERKISNNKSRQAGTGPSRRHIQGSKIAKRLPSVKYSFTVVENRKFFEIFFLKKLHTKKWTEWRAEKQCRFRR